MIRQEILSLLQSYRLAPLFISTCQNLLQDTSSSSLSSSSSSSSDDEFNAYILHAINLVKSTRYLVSRELLPKSVSLLHICLGYYRVNRPEEFRIYARMNPATFDELVRKLEGEPLFHNNSSNQGQQIPVDQQLFTTLIRMGTYGNGASLSKIGLFCGMEKGTVDLITRRVITAITSSHLHTIHIRWPAQNEKEAAKEWAQDQIQVSKWRNGFCMIDGTLIPLCRKPSHHGDTSYDRKSNYSISVQIINLPNRKIIDYASGFRGS